MIEHCSALVFRIKTLLAKYVLIPLIVLIAMPFAALYQLSLTLRCQKTKMRLSSVFELEREILVASCNVAATVREVSHEVMIKDKCFPVRGFDVPCQRRNGKAKTILLLHGTASSAVNWAKLFDKLSQEYRLLAPDLPGFGPVNLPSNLAGESTADAIDCYVAALEAFLAGQLGSEPVYVVAHSLGCFYATHYAVLHPQRILGMVLADPAGLLPTLGVKGATYAYFFKHSITNLPRDWGQLGFWLLSLLLHAKGASAEAHFWLSVLASPKTWGDKVLAKFITLEWSRAHWNQPSLGHLAALAARRVPLLIVHGSDDDIMPAHQGDLVRLLLGVPNTRLEGVGHSPLHGDTALKFAEIVLANLGEQESGVRGEPPSRSVPRLDLDWQGGLSRVHRTPFHQGRAAEVIAAFYRRLLEQCPGLEGVEVPPRIFDAEVIPYGSRLSNT